MNERIYYSHEAEEQAKRQQLLVVILFAAFGLAIGTALALLFAPSKGEETRRTLSHTIEDSMDAGRDVSSEALHKVETELADLRKQFTQLLDHRS